MKFTSLSFTTLFLGVFVGACSAQAEAATTATDAAEGSDAGDELADMAPGPDAHDEMTDAAPGPDTHDQGADASTEFTAPADATSENDCRLELLARGVRFNAAVVPLEYPQGRPDLPCTIDDPLWLEPTLRGLTLRPDTFDGTPEPLLVTCTLAIAIDRTAEAFARRDVTDVVHFGTYGCRVIGGTDQLSEHGRARAFDIAGVRLASGTTYTVLADWEQGQPLPATAGGVFLRDTMTSLFDQKVFNIILTPDYNAEHRNHFHCDLTPGARFLR